MCTVCGCGEGETRVEGHDHHGDHSHAHEHSHTHEHGHGHVLHSHEHSHDHDHSHDHEEGQGHHHAHDHLHGHDHPHDHDHTHEDGLFHPVKGDLHFGLGPARTHAPGLTQARMVQIEQDILGKNNGYAAKNRQHFAERGVFALNLVSSPGSGKTTLLVESIKALAGRHPVAVIEGDQQTSNDADRIRATGASAIQINTGKGCHLDAHMVGHALERIALPESGVLFIENVGNLVCPAAFDLGEAYKVAILSVTEGEDKPLKYPDMFHAAQVMILNKIDLLPHLDFDVDKCIAFARRVNPGIQVLQLSARTGEGMSAWLDWVSAGVERAVAQQKATVDALKRRNAELEAEVAMLKARERS